MTFQRPWHGSPAARTGVPHSATFNPLTLPVGARPTPAADATNGGARGAVRDRSAESRDAPRGGGAAGGDAARSRPAGRHPRTGDELALSESPGRGRPGSRAVRLAVVIAVALSTLLATTAVATAAQWQYFQTDGDSFYDVAAIDRNANGLFGDIWFDLDNDGAYDTNLYNTRYSDSLLEVIDFDFDENDEIDARLQDGDQRVGFDYIYVDRDQNGYWDRWRGQKRRIIPGSNIDNVTRSNRHNASSRLINDYRQQTGISLLYPSLPTPY
jgi:hypothetical protein